MRLEEAIVIEECGCGCEGRDGGRQGIVSRQKSWEMWSSDKN